MTQKPNSLSTSDNPFHDKKCFGVRFSGHGSAFIPEQPLYNLTLNEAKQQALDWELKADTIGGRAEIVTVLDFLD